MASLAPALLHPTSIVTTSVQAFVTGEPAAKTKITRLVLSNFSTGTASVTAWLVPSGGGALDSNVIMPITAIPAHQAIAPLALQGLVLNAGDTLQMTCDEATAVNATACGLVFIP